ncbi:hypothetical protein EON64_07750, partial [archaeon]
MRLGQPSLGDSAALPCSRQVGVLQERGSMLIELCTYLPLQPPFLPVTLPSHSALDITFSPLCTTLVLRFQRA